MENKTMYNWHTDTNRGVCVNMLIQFLILLLLDILRMYLTLFMNYSIFQAQDIYLTIRKNIWLLIMTDRVCSYNRIFRR